ncbi:MAG: aminopeptidase [Halobacteria archaeon]|nr:aminopeptidase [Halobacteria archaeon]
MDQRVKEHAKILVDWSTGVSEGENVLIKATEDAHDLVIALHEEIGKRGAKPVTLFSSNEASRAYLLNHEGEFETPDHELALYENSDVAIHISSDTNLMAMSDVPGDVASNHSKARNPVREVRLSKRWCKTQHPTNAFAQNAGMSLSEYRDFVYSAILRDWEEVEEYQEELRRRLERASEVRLVGDETDLNMSVNGMHAVNSCGHHNMPSGEVFTAPVRDSVEGEILFDKPLIHEGREIQGVRLKFKEGKIVDCSAERNQGLLNDILETDEGARYIGELGIGTNRQIDRFTRNMLFDEKMGETIHMAVGRAYTRTVGEGRKQNKSAIHVDMIKDMSQGRIEFDDEVVQENGKFVWE